MAKRLMVTWLVFLTLASACRTIRQVKLDRADEASVSFLPWTSDQQALMISSCLSRAGERLKGEAATACACLVAEAARRWPFETYAAKEDEYLNQLIEDGVAASSTCESADSIAARKLWQPAMSLRRNANERFNALTPALAMSPASERLVVAWAQDEELGSKASIFAKTFQPATGWTESRYIDANDSPSSFSGSPRVAFLSASAGLVVWQKDDGTLRSIWAAAFDGDNWQNATRLEVNVTQSPERFAFAAHPSSGQIAIAWSQRNGANQEIRVRRYRNGQWLLSEVVDRGTRQSFTPSLHFTDDGELFAVWAEARAASDYHVVSSRTVQKSWTEPVTLASTGGEFPYSPTLASGPAQAVALAWLQDARTTDAAAGVTTLTTKIMALLRTSTGVWQSTPSVLEDQKGGDGFKGSADESLQLAVDGKNFVHAVWQKQEGTVFKLWTARANGTLWSTKELLYPNVAGVLKSPVVVASSEDLIVGFEQQDGLRQDVLGASWQGVEWVKATALEDVPDPASMAAAVTSRGEAAILWTVQPETGDGNELFLSLYRKTAP